VKKILILGEHYNYWTKKLSHIKNLTFTDSLNDKSIEIIFGHEKDILALNYENYDNLRWLQLLSAGANQGFKKKIFSNLIVTTSKGIHGQSMFEYILQGLLYLYNGDIFKPKNIKNWIRIKRNLVLQPNQKILLLGAGNIGRFLAEKFSNIGMNVDVLVNNFREIKNIKKVYDSIDAIPLSNYSIIISTLPLTKNTNKLVDKNFLNSLSINSVFINLGRGGTVDETYLFEILFKRKIKGAILDTYETEPIKKDNFKFEKLDNCLCSPHISGYFHESHDLFVSKFEKLFQEYCSNHLRSEINNVY